MTQLWRAPRPLVLASKSAARRGLLEAAGIPIITEGAAVDERRNLDLVADVHAIVVAAGVNRDRSDVVHIEGEVPMLRGVLMGVGIGAVVGLVNAALVEGLRISPVIITLGAALLGFVAGEMLVTDHAVEAFFHSAGRASTTIIEIAGAVGVVVVGRWLAARKRRAAGDAGVDG